MSKLIEKFKQEQTKENAEKIVKYLRKHPMADSFCDKQDRDLIVSARQLLEKK